MAIVPLERMRVEANFKEVQLRRMRIGQPASVVADLYGGKVKYHGTVQGVGLGTGAAFALLPAQNATGNWIKVVQRVPVRIALRAARSLRRIRCASGSRHASASRPAMTPGPRSRRACARSPCSPPTPTS